MKINKVLIIVAFFLSVSASNAGWFGASLGKEPSLTVFGQTLTVPVPSVVLGAEAGTSVGARASSSGVGFTLPFCKVGIKTPTLTVGPKEGKINVSTSGVKKAGSGASKKAAAIRKKRAAAKKSKK